MHIQKTETVSMLKKWIVCPIAAALCLCAGSLPATAAPAMKTNFSAVSTAKPEAAPEVHFVCTSNKKDGVFKKGEKIKFNIQLVGEDGKPMIGWKVRYGFCTDHSGNVFNPDSLGMKLKSCWKMLL